MLERKLGPGHEHNGSHPDHLRNIGQRRLGAGVGISQHTNGRSLGRSVWGGTSSRSLLLHVCYVPMARRLSHYSFIHSYLELHSGRIKEPQLGLPGEIEQLCYDEVSCH